MFKKHLNKEGKGERRVGRVALAAGALGLSLAGGMANAQHAEAASGVGQYSGGWNYGMCSRDARFVTMNSVQAAGTYVKMAMYKSDTCGTYWAVAGAPYDSSVKLQPSVWHPSGKSQVDYLGSQQTPMDGINGNQECMGTQVYRNGKWVAWVFEGCVNI